MKYYSVDKKRVIEDLKSDEIVGLTSNEVLSRRKIYGINALPKKKSDSFLKIFLHEFIDPIIILLIITIIFSIFIGEFVDAIVIAFIIIIDAIVGAVQENNANKNADSLSELIKYTIKVIRNNEEKEVESFELVPGDIVLVESGDKIPADMRVLETFNLQVNESVLTGESVNIYKTSDKQDEKCILADRKCMLYAGSNVTSGRGKAIVCATGINTEVGHIAKTVTNMEEQKSPLTIRMDKLSKQISILILVIGVFIGIILAIKGQNIETIFMSVVALSVSAMPEGLPLALTMALTITSNKMAKKNVIVKKLNYVESLGSTTVIATDKTGTLTVNEQTAKLITFPNNLEYYVDGVGYNFDGGIVDFHDEKYIKEICILGSLNNEASIIKKGNKYQYYGDSIDIAFQVLKEKSHVNTDDFQVLKRIPYESENKYSAVFYKYRGEIFCTVKGSLEKVMEFSKTMDYAGVIQKINKKRMLEQNERLAREGYRVIAIASGKVDNFVNKDIYESSDIPNLTFKGMVSFIDPVRKEVKQSIKECMNASVKVIMITGDHPLTAFAIGKELSLCQEFDEIVTGQELEEALKKGEKYFDDFIENKKIFARVTPNDKLEIVNSLKRRDEFVAVTGDGVNDALAIRSANIGISVGSGTDVAKETANMIIVDDNFKSIVSGIRLGRTAYSNIRKVCYFLLSCGLSEVLFFLLSVISDLPMPLVAIQLLWLNLVTDGLQDISLSYEKAEDGIMNEKPVSTKENIFNKKLLEEVIIMGTTIGLVVFAVWAILIKVYHFAPENARGYVMALMVFIQNVHVLNCRSEKESIFKISLLRNPILIVTILGSVLLHILVMNVPLLSSFLKTSTISAKNMFVLFFISLTILIVGEFYKYIKNEKKQV